MLKVASYNIHKAIGTDRRRNPGRIIDVLNELDADIVALQESDRRFGVRAAAIPALLLEQNSDYRAIPLDVQIDSMGWHGNAILVRRSAIVHAHDIIHIPCLEPRGAVRAHIEIGDMHISTFGMHLDLSGLWRRKQAAAVINEWSANRGCLSDFKRSYSIVECGRSFHSRSPIARLDRIMHCPGLTAIEAGVHHSLAAKKASDHLPVWADLVENSCG